MDLQEYDEDNKEDELSEYLEHSSDDCALVDENGGSDDEEEDVYRTTARTSFRS
jgi:hypothetical protein